MDAIEAYLRHRLRQRVRRKTRAGYRKGGIQASTVHQEFRVLRRMLNLAVRKKLLPSNPCSGVEFPVAVKGLFRPHYVSWSEQQRIESRPRSTCATSIRIITETGLRIYKELTPMRKDQVDLANAVVWIPDSKTPNGVAEVPLTDRGRGVSGPDADRGTGTVLVPERQESDRASDHVQDGLGGDTAACERPVLPDLRFAFDLCDRLSAGGVADEWVTQLLRQGDAKVFKKYSQMKLQMKREALQKMNRSANESGFGTGRVIKGFGTVLGQFSPGKANDSN